MAKKQPATPVLQDREIEEIAVETSVIVRLIARLVSFFMKG